MRKNLRQISGIILATLFLAGMEWVNLGVVQAQPQNSPVIFYTDITSGPNTGGENNNGCYLTIAGKGFGSSWGSSTVTIGGGEVAEYKVWTDTEIAVQIGNNARTGPIIVTVNGKKATTVDLLYREPGDIQFTVRDANIYFSAPWGNNANPGTFELPKASVGGSTGAKRVMSGGDFLYARGGDYVHDDTYNCFFRMDAAWDGSEGAPTVISGYPDETVSTSGGPITRPYGTTSRHDYVFAHFVHLGAYSVALKGTDRIRVIDIDMSGGTGAAGSVYTEKISYCYFYGNKIHDNAASADNLFHLMYMSNAVSLPAHESHHLYFGWNELYSTTNGVDGLHFYTDRPDTEIRSFDYIYIHHNLFHDIVRSGLMLGSYEKNTWVWNNIFYNCATSSFFGIYFNGMMPGYMVHVYNNTFYNNRDHIGLRGGNPTNVEIKNNLFYSTFPSQDYIIDYDRDWPDDLLTVSKNLYYGAGGSYYLDTNPINADPQFINAPTHDFHLQEASPAIDAGTNQLFSPVFPTLVVNNDYDGTLRPQGSAYDIGAYEYVVQPSGLRGDVNGDGLVNIVDVQLAVNQFLGVAPQTPAADLNGDGVVNVIDVQQLVNIILGG